MPPQQIPPVNNVPNPSPANNPELSKPRRYGFLIITTLLLIITGAFGVWYFSNPLPEEEINSSTPLTTSTSIPMVGNDKDEHGCIGSAGYSWCAAKNKCLRSWEEKCE